MECYKCSVSGKKIVYMEVHYDTKRGASIAVCPECGREETVGYGRI